MRLLNKLFKKETDPAPEKTACVPASRQEPYLTQTVVYGMHLYRRPGDDSSVYFVDENRGIRKMLVDSFGNIQNFPGIVREKFWTRHVSKQGISPQIRFRTSFEKRGNQWILLWQIQPDGRYWADDDGFGMENEEEVTLYTYVDQNGQFTGPFRIYEVGCHPYTLDRFEYAPQRWYDEYLQKLKDGNLETTHIQKPEDLLFPCLRNTPKYYNDRNSYVFWSREEALAYWKNPALSQKLLEATELLLQSDKSIQEIGSYGCQYKIRACMTLFWRLTGDERFQAVLEKFFDGETDRETDGLLL